MLRHSILLSLALLAACSTTNNDVGRGRADAGSDVADASSADTAVWVPGPVAVDGAGMPAPVDAAVSIDAAETPTPADAATMCGTVPGPRSLADLPGASFDLFATEKAPGSMDRPVYAAVAPTPVARIAVSADGATVAMESLGDGTMFAGVTGKRTSADPAWAYDLKLWAGGSLVLRAVDCGVQAEVIEFGSGVPIVAAWRGLLRLASAADAAPVDSQPSSVGDAGPDASSVVHVNDLSLLPGGKFDFWATGESDHPKALDSAGYTALEPTAIVHITFSADGATASLESVGAGYKGLVINGTGQRTITGSTWIYELNTAPGGGTLRLRASDATVIAELALFGSGVPIIVAWRGELRAGPDEILWPTARFHLVDPATVATPFGITLRVRDGNADGGTAEAMVSWPADSTAGGRISFKSLGSPPSPAFWLQIDGLSSSRQPATLQLHAFQSATAAGLAGVGKYGFYTDAEGLRCGIRMATLVIDLPRTWASNGVVTGNATNAVVRGSFSGECVLPDGGVRYLDGSFELPSTWDVIILTG